MQLSGKAAGSIFLAILCASAAAAARADDACRDFKWDVSKERALFAGPSTSVVGGTDLKSAPSLVPNRLYQLQLKPQDQVNFPAAPGKKTSAAATYAGIATVKISQPGSYRFALDAPFWIDVVSGGSLLTAQDFQGQHECDAPHKIVEFDLVGSPPFVLQLSGAAAESIRLTITPTPSRKL
jgi:hypothetical protein